MSKPADNRGTVLAMRSTECGSNSHRHLDKDIFPRRSECGRAPARTPIQPPPQNSCRCVDSTADIRLGSLALEGLDDFRRTVAPISNRFMDRNLILFANPL